MSVSLGEEFRLKNFGLGYNKPHQFSEAQWRGFPHGVFIGWRVFWVLWHLAWLARSVQLQIVEDSNYDPGESAKWLIYLTNWSYLVLTIQSILHLVVVICTRRCHGDRPTCREGATTSWYEKLLWVFTSFSFAAAIVVVIFYWTLVFKELTHAVSVMTHGVTALYVVTDMFISASPVRLLHFIYPMLYGLAYAIFSVFYHLADGTNNSGKPYIYSSLDWSKPGVTAGIAAGVAFVATPLCHLFIFGLYTLRVYIRHSCCGDVSPADDEEPATGKPDRRGEP